MKKFLRVTMTDGSVWDIPIMLIIHHRANYYAERESEEDPQAYYQVYDQEIDCCADIHGELIEWARTQMTWEDVEEFAERVDGLEVNFNDGWLYGPMSIVDKGEIEENFT